jgi:FlaA1/EpsC-like NDP-sugar epimerase
MNNRFNLHPRILLAGDIFLMIVAVLASFVLRLNFGTRLGDFRPQILTMILLAMAIRPLIYYRFGLYRRIWIYASVQEVKLIVTAVSISSVLMFACIATIQYFQFFHEFPRLVVLIDWLCSLVFVGGLRFSLRVMAEARASTDLVNARRVMIVGAGDAGALVAREMQKNAQSRLKPVCFVDDDPEKQKYGVHGIKVAGALKDLPRLAEAYHVDEVIIAIPSAPGRIIHTVTDLCRIKGLPFRIIPSLNELISGKVSVNRLREVEITDLLRREPAHTDDKLVGSSLQGKRVLISGAGGSIGRELCRQAAGWNPVQMILLGHGENSIFEVLTELHQDYPELLIQPIIADVRDRPRLVRIFAEYRPEVVFHAAAHKHVTLMEDNVPEAITNNVLGTRNMVECALAASVERMVMISTDKAVRPTSVMGASKRMAEMIVLDTAARSGKPFSVVRFGNVLGSRGSVIPLFKRQIANGGPVTLRHPDMRRYFMTIPEAVHLVLQAFAMGQGGEVFVLNMGEQVRIHDLAEDLIRLSGLEPGRDIEIVYTGAHPGEKLSEALWDDDARLTDTAHPDVLCLASDERLEGDTLQQAADELIRLAEQGDAPAILHALNRLVPHAELMSKVESPRSSDL